MDMNSIINNTLLQYGAALNDAGYITKADKVTSVRPVIKGKRLRFEGKHGLIMSGGLNAQTVATFVEQFWLWEIIPSQNAIQ